MTFSLQHEMMGCLTIALDSMETDQELWQRYLTDFIQEKLGLRSITRTITPQNLKSVFTQIDQANSVSPVHSSPISCQVQDQLFPQLPNAYSGPLNKVGCQAVALHISFYIRHWYFKKVTPVLKMLDDLESMMETIYESSSKFNSPLSVLGKPDDLCGYTVELLFHFVLEATKSRCCYPLQWYWFYQKIVST